MCDRCPKSVRAYHNGHEENLSHFTSKVLCYLSVTTAAGRDTLLPGPAIITHCSCIIYGSIPWPAALAPGWSAGARDPAAGDWSRMQHVTKLQCCTHCTAGTCPSVPRRAGVVSNTGRILRCKHPIKAGCVPIYFKRRIIQGKYFDRFLLWLIKAKMHFIYDLGGSKL